MGYPDFRDAGVREEVVAREECLRKEEEKGRADAGFVFGCC